MNNIASMVSGKLWSNDVTFHPSYISLYAACLATESFEIYFQNLDSVWELLGSDICKFFKFPIPREHPEKCRVCMPRSGRRAVWSVWKRECSRYLNKIVLGTGVEGFDLSQEDPLLNVASIEQNIVKHKHSLLFPQYTAGWDGSRGCISTQWKMFQVMESPSLDKESQKKLT